jgi:Flp pilus assembly pilin Flp
VWTTRNAITQTAYPFWYFCRTIRCAIFLPRQGEPVSSEVETVRITSRGQGLAEYALILALIAILAITALLFLSGQIDTILSTIGNAL